MSSCPVPSAFESPQVGPQPGKGLLAGLAVVLVLAVIVAGSPELDAPWILGDEFVFIVNNPDVNPDAEPDGRPRPLGSRLFAIWTKIHDDLYQPIPILTYALEWAVAKGNPASFRSTDLLLHALNGLLLWWVLALLLRRTTQRSAVPTTVSAWGLALLWALHPALVTTYASDMGRTHLLSATFALLALGFHVLGLARGAWYWYAGALAALTAAMLCKAIPGWLLVVLVVEGLHLGWRRALASPRLYIVTALCIASAALTIWTSARSGLAEDASKGLFGDPLARSALAVWIYFRNLVAPLWLAVWNLPDPETGWGHPRVWAGLTLALASMAHALWCWRRPETRLITFGWAWCWGLLLPVVGLVGAREAAAVDRYLYQPLMGILLVIGTPLASWLAALQPAKALRARRAVLAVVGTLALAMLLLDLPLCAVNRSVIRRAKRIVEMNPGDPRALEALAAAYDFAQNHPLPAADLEGVAKTGSQAVYFRKLWQDTLVQAANAENLPHFFPGPEDRGPFHRRLSYRFLRAGLPNQSLAQALEAFKLLPDEYTTWVRLAQAHRALGQFDEAAAAYQRAEQLLPQDPLTRAVHFADYGYMLMFDLERDADACSRFLAAFEVDRPPPPAKVGLALCQIRYGQGVVGFQLISETLNDKRIRDNPTLAVQAGLVLAEYHLRSHHWDQAGVIYAALLHDYPTNYPALRGLTEVCFQTNRPDQAVSAWREALRHEPTRREFSSFLVWSMALAGDKSTAAAAYELLEADPHNPLGCLALSLDSLRSGDPAAAIAWVDQARLGQPIPKAREFERAAAVLQVLTDRGELPSEAVLVRAAMILGSGSDKTTREKAAVLLDAYASSNPESASWGLLEELRRRLSDPASLP